MWHCSTMTLLMPSSIDIPSPDIRQYQLTAVLNHFRPTSINAAPQFYTKPFLPIHPPQHLPHRQVKQHSCSHLRILHETHEMQLNIFSLILWLSRSFHISPILFARLCLLLASWSGEHGSKRAVLVNSKALGSILLDGRESLRKRGRDRGGERPYLSRVERRTRMKKVVWECLSYYTRR